MNHIIAPFALASLIASGAVAFIISDYTSTPTTVSSHYERSSAELDLSKFSIELAQSPDYPVQKNSETAKSFVQWSNGSLLPMEQFEITILKSFSSANGLELVAESNKDGKIYYSFRGNRAVSLQDFLEFTYASNNRTNYNAIPVSLLGQLAQNSSI